MWIRQVTAHAFGPFKGDTLHLAEGMTVVVGDNEAGKSSWHAAIYAGLCGMRRGKGRRPKEDEEFAARHAPWDGGPWEVEALVRLAEGRTVELRHDLGAQVSSSVRDVDLGHDLASEIIHDGAPDGSRWLGLDRRAFAAVACVRQAEILAVTQHADSLQRHLQRAAATAGTDETAATALKALDTFLREHVGSERATTKPLMEAIRAHRAADDRLQQAVGAHTDWQEREEALGQVEAQASAASQRLRAARARRANQLADVVARRVATARTLAAAHPEPPPSVSADDELAARVATALHGWTNRPVVTSTDARSVGEIQQMLDAVPTRPEGDLEPEADVTRLRRILADAVTRHEAHRLSAAVAGGNVDSGGATESELVDLARELAAPHPVVDPALVTEAERLRQQQSPGGRARRPAAIAAAAVATLAVIAGSGLVAAGHVPVGAGALVLGALSGAVAVVVLLTASRTGPDGRTERQVIEARLAIAEQRLDEARERRAQVEQRTRELGLEPDPAALRRLADEMRHSEQAAAARQQWDTAHARLAAEVAHVGQQLGAVLAARGVDVASDTDPAGLLAAVDDYEQACRQRREVAVQAQQRDILLAELHAAERAESRRRDDERRLEAARSALIEVATDLGLADGDGDTVVAEADVLVARLQSWGADRDRRRAATEQALDEWHQLQALLDGRSLDDLEAEAARLRHSADELCATLPCEVVDQVDLGTDPDSTLRQLQQHAEQLNVSLAEARRELAVRAESLVPVAEATEALELATAELDRVRRLERTLTTTQQFMLQAQERVHRDIAPVLVAKVEGRLSRVTGGRYSQVTIDPETLGVTVRDTDGRWRNASYLSHGTAEQVFLLLRVAMSEILAKGRCPLLLDDVTVQSDARRTHAILDVLHEVSAEHQVILFSQEDDVVNWATSHLGDRDRLVRLVSPS